MKRVRIIAAVVAVCLGAALAPAQPASATLDGEGRLIAFVSTEDGDADIFTIRPDGTNRQQVTNNGVDDTSPAFSSDGHFLAFVRPDGGDRDILILNLETLQLTNVTSASTADESSPTFAPDGVRMAFASSRNGVSQIFTQQVFSGLGAVIANAQATAETTVTSNASDPDWSSQDEIAFVSDRDGRDREIYVLNLADRTVDQLTFDNPEVTGDARRDAIEAAKASDYEPSWAPDGSRLVYRHYPSSVRVVQRSGGSTVVGAGAGPAFSPDGLRIAMTAPPSGCTNVGCWKLHVMNQDGSGRVALNSSTAAFIESAPAWQTLKCPGHGPLPADLQIVGTPGDDVLFVPAGRIACGLGGNDTLIALDGNSGSVLLGGRGNDFLFASPDEDDELVGGFDNDTLCADNGGRDFVRGGNERSSTPLNENAGFDVADVGLSDVVSSIDSFEGEDACEARADQLNLNY